MEDGAGHREHFPSLLCRKLGGNERAARLPRLYDHHTHRQPADDTVARGKVGRFGPHVQRVFRDQCAVLHDALGQVPMLVGIQVTKATAQHRDGASPRVQRSLMRDPVNAQGQPADHGDTLPRQVTGQHPRGIPAVVCWPPCAHYSHGPLILRQQGTQHV